MSDWDETYRQLQAQFVKLSQERLDDMERILQKLGQTPQDAQMMRDLARHFHSLKGAGASYGFPGISDKCRAAQDEVRKLAESEAWPTDTEIGHWRDIVVAVRLELAAPASTKGPE
jgi:chemotaxis protein histidine kinase CheA